MPQTTGRIQRQADELSQEITERKQVEKALRGSEKKYRTLIDEAPVGICHVDITGKVTYVNRRFEKISGYSRDEVVGKNGFKLGMFPNETVKLLGKRMKDRLMGKPPRVLETQFKCKDGHWIWVAIEGKLMREEGIPVGFQIISRDITKSKRVEEELRRAELEKTAILDSMSEIVIFQDMEHRLIWANKVAGESVNLSPEQLVGRYCYEIWHKRSKPCVGCPVAKAREMGQPQASEITTSDGRVWFVRGYPIRDANGDIVSLVESALDITEHKWVDEELVASEEKLQRMFESITDGISVIDLNGVITEVNQKTVEMHGFGSKDELLGRSAFELVAPRDHKRIATNMRKAVKQGTIRDIEYTLLKADNSEFPGELSTSMLKDASGNPVGHITIARDVTERKRMVEAVSLMALFAELDPAPVIRFDKDGKVLMANRAAYELFGKQLVTGTSLFSILPDIEGLALDAYTRDGAITSHSTEIGNRFFHFTFRGVPELSIGQIYGSDITELKRTEEALKEEQERLKRQDKERLEFIGVVSHELKTPLTSLIASGSLLSEELSGEPDSPQAMLIKNIEHATRSMDERLSELLNLAKMGISELMIQPIPLDIGQLIGQTVSQFNPIAQKRNQPLTLESPSSLPKVKADPQRLEQVLLNLLTNASKFSPEGSKIAVRAGRQGDNVLVEVEDNGPGISKEAQGRIFELYYRTEADRQRIPGLGLGLALSKRLLEEQGGKLWLNSELGKGSIFSFSLPLMQNGEET